MRIPGITTITTTSAANITHNMVLEALAGKVPDLSGIIFAPVPFVGNPVCDRDSSNDNNGTNESITLTFLLQKKIDYPCNAFVVTQATGESFLIGAKECVPKVTFRDHTAGPAEANRTQVTVELNAYKAWIPLGAVAPIVTGSAQDVVYDAWREVTTEEIDDMLNGLTL